MTQKSIQFFDGYSSEIVPSVTVPTGPAGADGSDGIDGKSVLNGTVDPTTEGVDGDFYINTTSNQIFGPKTGGVWGTGTDLVGTDGAGVPTGGTTGQVLSKIDGTDFNTQWSTPNVTGAAVARFESQTGSSEGTASAGDNLRKLTFRVEYSSDGSSFFSLTDLSGDHFESFTLEPGIYMIEAKAPAYRVGLHYLKLQRWTGAIWTTEGNCPSVAETSDTVSGENSMTALSCNVNVGSSTKYRILHNVASTKISDGLGLYVSTDICGLVLSVTKLS